MWNDEELYNGTIAMEILNGLNLPLINYQYTPHNGGTIVIGVLAAFFFKLFGNTYFSLKLVALLLHTLSLIFCLVLLSRHFSNEVAALAGLFFLFSPSIYTESNLIACGIHADSIFLSMLAILIFYEIFFAGENNYLCNKKKSLLLFIAFGLINGFSLYFAYITVYCLLTCLFFWFLFDRKFFLKKSFLIFSISVLIGFLPWLYYNYQNRFKGLNIVKFYWLDTGRKNPIFQKILEYFAFDLPALFDFHGKKFFGLPILPYFYYFILLVAFFFIVYKEKGSFIKIFRAFIPSAKEEISPGIFPKEILFIIAPVIFTAIFFLSNISVFYTINEKAIAFRYFIPLFPFIFIILSLFFSKVIGKEIKSKNIPFVFLLIIILSLGLLGNAKIYYYDTTLTYKDLDGYYYERLGWTADKKFGHDFSKCLELGNKINPIYRHLYYYGIGWSMGGRGLIWKKRFEKYIEMEELIQSAPEKYKSYYYQGIGYILGINSVYNQFEQSINSLNRIDDKYKAYSYLGMAKAIKENLKEGTNVKKLLPQINVKYRKFFDPILADSFLKYALDLKRVEKASSNMSETDRVYVYQGIGAFMFKESNYKAEQFKKAMQNIPLKYKYACYEGAGTEIGFYFRNRIKEIEKEINRFEPEDRIPAYIGVGRYIAERYGFYFPEITKTSHLLGKQYLPYFYHGIGVQIAMRFGNNENASDSVLKELDPANRQLVEEGFREELTRPDSSFLLKE